MGYDFLSWQFNRMVNENKPFAKPWSNLKQPLVYMTSSKQLAAHYIWSTKKYEIKSPMLDIRFAGSVSSHAGLNNLILLPPLGLMRITTAV